MMFDDGFCAQDDGCVYGQDEIMMMNSKKLKKNFKASGGNTKNKRAFKAYVDSGANFSGFASAAESYMMDKEKVNTMVGDYGGKF